MLAVPTEWIPACPVCGDRRGRLICRSPDRQHGRSAQTFGYSRCVECGVVYQSLRPVEDRIATFYPDDYGPYQFGPLTVRADGAAAPQGPHPRPIARRRLRRWAIGMAEWLNGYLRRHYPDPFPPILDAAYAPPRPGATLLDFGCGSPDFLDRARRRGWDTLGADFIQPVVEAVRQSGHRALLCTESMWDEIPDGSLDFVRMNHVIEHLYQPRDTLSRLRRKLRTGGRLHLATPNAASLVFRVLRQRWFPLECPRHIVMYTPRSARRLLRAVGFSEAATYQEVLTKDTARSLGYVLHDLGRLNTAGALGLMNRPGLASLLFAPARLAALRGRADRFHAIAVA